MRARTALHVFIGILVAGALVFFASRLHSGSGSSLVEMLAAQRKTPLLWVVDVCALGFLAGIWWYAVMLNHFQKFSDHQALQHHDQLDDMIERTSDLERTNDTYSDRIERLESELNRQSNDLIHQIEALEAASEARRAVFETETRRIADQGSRSFQTHLDANTRQVEAMNMALQFQRGELRKLRHEIRDLQTKFSTQYVSPFRSPDIAAPLDSSVPVASYTAYPDDDEFDPYVDAPEDATAVPLTYETPEDRVSSQSAEEPRDGEPELAMVTHPEEESPESKPAEAAENTSWFSEYSGQSERSPGWKSHVERLFYEADAVESLAEANGAAHSGEPAETPPALRMVDSDAEPSAESASPPPHEEEGGSELSPATEATA